MKDYLILGQGLAGSLLAWELIHAGKSVIVIDNGHTTASSWVAAGLLNPITGMRMVKSPHTEAWLATADVLYSQVQEALSVHIRHALPMWRIFTNPKQQQAWQERLDEADYASYLSEIKSAEQALPYCAELGIGEVAQTGYIDTKLLLTTIKAWLMQRQSYQQMDCDYSRIVMDKDGVSIGDIRARRLIFCEGSRAIENPWFGDLPLTPVKGEILTLEHHQAMPNVIANFGKWVLPVSPQKFKLGATYDWEHRDQVPTEKAKTHLLDELDKYTGSKLPVRVVEHEVGLRPNSRDRLPLIGCHPNQDRLWIFNGFGSRGSLMIPYYAQQFRRHLLEAEPLDADCDIARWR